MGVRSGRRVLISGLVAAVGWAGPGSLSGCVPIPMSSCEQDFSCDSAVPAASSPCDGLLPWGPAKEGCGVFVARSGSDDNAGTKQAPMRTLHAAIRRAERDRTRRVFACAETFKETVTLPTGVDFWGGRTCGPGGDWSFTGTDSLTVIAPEPELVPMRVEGRAEESSLVFGVRLQAADAIRAGGSSIAMIVADGAAVQVSTSEIVAGNGADGEPGEDAPYTLAPLGAPGNPGSPGCQMDLTPGAPPAVTACDGGIESVGGSGGEGYATMGGDGADGLPLLSSNPIGAGKGGQAQGLGCENGLSGANGANGAPGSAMEGDALGSISAAGWKGVPGASGERGAVGQGGGGGGGVRGVGACRAMDPQGGAPGGSGGGGGCGGKGGKGGGPGGASLGILALHADVTLAATLLRIGTGGTGGVGGTGQPGGLGWAGGAGGPIPASTGMAFACDGGAGGTGGTGGCGLGGPGGPSVAIAYADTTLNIDKSVSYRVSQPASGGSMSDATLDECAGKQGTTAETKSFPEAAPAEEVPR